MSEGKIIVVEDNHFVRMQIVQFLKSSGFECDEAENANEALEQINGSYSAAVVDVRMEPMDGFEFIKTLRGRKLDLPVILVTGDQNPDILEQSAKWNVTTILLKPVQKDRLISMVTRAIAMEKRKKDKANGE
jgi:DNA-binding NtrC family response regulator